MSEIDYEEIAKNLEKLYSEKPELVFKLYNQLRKYFVTIDDFKQFMEQSNTQFQKLIQQMDKGFEESNKRFEEMNKRFEENRIETNKRFEEINKCFDRTDRRIDNLEKAMNRGFKEQAKGYGGTFEGFNKTILKKILEERGIPVKIFNVIPLHFEDPTRTVHPNSTDVEINIFNEDPPIIGEVTSSLVELEKLNIFIRKIQFIEKKFNKNFQRFFITLYIEDNIQTAAKALLKKYKIDVITLE